MIIKSAKTPLCKSHNVVLAETPTSTPASTPASNQAPGNQAPGSNGTDKKQTFKTKTTISAREESPNRRISVASQSSSPSSNELYGLVSPEEQMQALSGEYPSKFVPIDVSGASFQRMSCLRRSLIHVSCLPCLCLCLSFSDCCCLPFPAFAVFACLLLCHCELFRLM